MEWIHVPKGLLLLIMTEALRERTYVVEVDIKNLSVTSAQSQS